MKNETITTTNILGCSTTTLKLETTDESGVVNVYAKVDTTAIDEALAKVQRLVERLKEAKSLADEIASINLEIKIDGATISKVVCSEINEMSKSAKTSLLV